MLTLWEYLDPDNFTEQLTDTLKNLTIKHAHNDRLIYDISNTITKRQLANADVIKCVIEHVDIEQSEYVRISIYKLIGASGMPDEYLDTIFNCMSAHDTRKNAGDNATLIGEDINLAVLLEKFTRFDSYRKLINFLITDKNYIVRNQIDGNKDIAWGIAVDLAIKEFEAGDDSITDYCISLFSASWRFRELAAAYSAFRRFLTVVPADETFKALVDAKCPDSHLLAGLVTEDGIDYFINKRREGGTYPSESLIYYFHAALLIDKNELAEKMEAGLGSIPIPQQVAKEIQQKEDYQRDIDLLFDREAFLTQVNRAFSLGSEDELNEKEIWDWDDNEAEIEIQHIVRRVLIQHCDPVTKAVAKSDVLSQFSQNWSQIMLRYLAFLMKNRNGGSFSEEQIKQIKQALDTLFEQTSELDNEGLANSLVILHEKLDLVFPDNIYAALLRHPIGDWLQRIRDNHYWSGEGIAKNLHSFFVPRISEQKLNNEMIKILKEPQLGYHVYDQCISYCQLYGVREALPVLKSIITANPNHERGGESIQLSALDAYDGLIENDTVLLENMYGKVGGAVGGKLIRFLVRRNSPVAYNHYNKIASDPELTEEDQLDAARFFCQRNEVLGLELYLKYLQQYAEHDKFENNWLKVPTVEAVNVIADLIIFGVENNVTDAKYLVSHFVNELMEIAISSDDLGNSTAIAKLNMLKEKYQDHELLKPYLFHAPRQIEMDRRRRSNSPAGAWARALKIWNDQMLHPAK